LCRPHVFHLPPRRPPRPPPFPYTTLFRSRADRRRRGAPVAAGRGAGVRHRAGDPRRAARAQPRRLTSARALTRPERGTERARDRSEEHTSELQSRENLVCRLLLEKKNEKR